MAEIALVRVAALPNGVPAPDPLLPVVGASMEAVVRALGQFARMDETILLQGPTGCGKTRLAGWCHGRSTRSNGPFEQVDLAASPDELQLSAIVGWRRGAFTGAAGDTRGALARAAGGTLFIDEVDKLSRRSQAGLLGILESRRYRPLGDGSSERHADVRFIVGTNANLRERVRSGAFREDLYYRINVLAMRIPALAERSDEIAGWAAHMLGEISRRNTASAGEARPPTLSPDAAHVLGEQPWPGNLRELENVLRRAYAFALLDGGGGRAELCVDTRHVEQALAQDREDGDRALLESFRRTAQVFVKHARRRRVKGQALDLDATSALRGFVLLAAARHGGIDGALRLLGHEREIDTGNRIRFVRREIERAVDLCTLVGLPRAGGRLQEMMHSLQESRREKAADVTGDGEQPRKSRRRRAPGPGVALARDRAQELEGDLENPRERSGGVGNGHVASGPSGAREPRPPVD